jgi:glycosyl transferase family 25
LHDHARFRTHVGRTMSPAELGCALSHLSVYRKVISEGLSHALILEDDAFLNPNVPSVLRAIVENVPSNLKQVTLLTWCVSLNVGSSRPLWAGYRLAEIDSAMCAHGYVVTNAAAARLLTVLDPVCHVADAWDWMRKRGFVRVDAVYPPCITGDLSHRSHLALEVAAEAHQESKFQRSLFRLRRGFRSLTGSRD